MSLPVKEIQQRVESSREDIIEFMRDICAIPSMDSNCKDAYERFGIGLYALFPKMLEGKS